MTHEPVPAESNAAPAKPTDEAVRPTAVQFNLRQLLVLTLAAAVLAALVAPLVRNVQDSLWQRIAALVGVALVSGGAWAIWLCQKRRQAELQAGRERLRIRSRFGQKWWSRHLVYFGWCCQTGVMWVLCSINPVLRGQSPPLDHEFFRIWLPLICSALMGFQLTMPTLHYWWRLLPPTFELCEQGIICAGYSFIPWQKIRRWSITGQQKTTLTFFANTHIYSTTLAPELVDEVEQIFTESVACDEKQNAAAQTPQASTRANP